MSLAKKGKPGRAWTQESKDKARESAKKRGITPETREKITASLIKNMKNRKFYNSRHITYNGYTKNITDWADATGINRGTILYRLKHNWSIEEVFKKFDCRLVPKRNRHV